MKKSLLFSLLLVTALTAGRSEPVPKKIAATITAAIREHCPDAAIESTNDGFSAKNDSMSFILHERLMTGRISDTTYREEGPNFKGFVLKIIVFQGAYAGQLVLPQELGGPYYPTFLTAIPTPDGKGHYWISFSYGKGLDPKLKKAILDALPTRPGADH